MAERSSEAAAALARLTDVSRALTYAASLDEVLEITVDCAVDLLGADRAVLMLEEDDGLLRIRAARGVPEARAADFREPLDESLIARLDAVLGPRAEEGFLGVPLVVRGGVIGLLAVLSAEGEPHSERDEWLLSALADQASVAVASTREGSTGSGADAEAPLVERAGFRPDDALRMVTHDLRSPLSALQGYLHLLGDELYGPLTDAQRSALQRLKAVSRHLQGLVANVVEMDRLAAGTLTLRCEPVGVAEVAAEAATMVDLDARSRAVEVVVAVPGSLTALAEPDRLRQVLVQLLENAVRYAPSGTTVTVEAERAGTADVKIRVVDEGPGIPNDQTETIFQPYHRLEPGARGAGGLGLGLAIARSLVRLMGGTLEVDPARERGAAFVLTVAAADGSR